MSTCGLSWSLCRMSAFFFRKDVEHDATKQASGFKDDHYDDKDEQYDLGIVTKEHIAESVDKTDQQAGPYRPVSSV